MLMTERERLVEELRALVDSFGGNRTALLPVLQTVQKKYRHVSDYAMQVLADLLRIHPVEVYSVVSFYSFLDHKPKGQFVIRLCRTISCDMQHKDRVARQLETDLGIRFGETTPDGKFSLEWAHCIGMCDQGPALLVNDGVHTHVTPERVHDILEGCRRTFGVHALNQAGRDGSRNGAPASTAANGNALTFAGIPADAGLTSALAKSRADIIAEIRASGLRGRGGAGFPTGIKWNLAAAAQGQEKYVVCNADEGEPGTFKDRVILSEYADLVFEGMTVGGLAIGAEKGILYLRGEYTYLLPRLQTVLASRLERNLLGRNILGMNRLNFNIEIRMGSGAYICGEETALIESLEGQRGEPRNRPPFPVDTGFMSRPSVVNNVETLAWVTCILAKGVEWFKSAGTEKSTGHKLFSVSGDCDRPGVYEFPMGISINELLEEVGGRGAKAVQIGGASGHCVPASAFARTLAYEDIPTGGSVIVLGKGRDLLAAAKNFLDFFVDESCGQCSPCRYGNPKLLEGVELLREGRCSMTYLKELCGLGESMQLASKCGLGQTSPNAFLSIVEHFREEIMGRSNHSA